LKNYKLFKSYKIPEKIKNCNNDCIFCFIKQLPVSLRPSLYIKDDDYLLSYMYGNFITLTNVRKEDLDKIVKYKLEPLYISIHSMDEKIREVIFGNKKTMCGLENFEFLDKKGIKTNIQIVLCPGINDGRDLDNTLFTLINNYKNILSIGIVPVGITKYNKNNILKSYNKESSIALINDINSFKKFYMSLKKTSIIYLSDEFYVLGGIKFPQYKYYKKFYQIENGVGKSTYFLKQIKDFIKNHNIVNYISSNMNKSNKYKYTLLITSEYGKVVIENAINIILEKLGSAGKRISSYLKILKVVNKFLGGNIKITGLLSGKDIELNLKREDMRVYDKILIPDSIFNKENLTIDNYTKQDLEKISKKIKIIPENGSSFIKEICFK